MVCIIFSVVVGDVAGAGIIVAVVDAAVAGNTDVGAVGISTVTGTDVAGVDVVVDVIADVVADATDTAVTGADITGAAGAERVLRVLWSLALPALVL